MRVLFWILLLGNVILFAVMQWGGMSLGDGQAVQAQPPLREGSILLLNPQGMPDMAQSAPAHSAVPVAASAPVTTEPIKAACMEWGDFSGEGFDRASKALADLQLGNKLSQRQVEHSIGYWVYIPPLKNKAAASQKIAQLKARGIGEYFVVQEAGPWLNAISLGVFRTQEAAQNFLNELRTKDVRSAQIGERASKLKATIFVLNELDNETVNKLTAMQKDFAGSELKSVSCANNSH